MRFLPGLLTVLAGVAAFNILHTPAHSQVAPRNLLSYLSLLDPAAGIDSIDEAAAPEHAARFRPVAGPDVHLGYTDEAYWFRFTLAVPVDTFPLVLEISNPQLLSVTLYTPDGAGGFSAESVGVAEPFWVRPVVALTPTFPLRLDTGVPQTFYLRVQHYGALRFSARVVPASMAREQANLRLSLNLLLAGALLGLAVFNGCIFAGLRQTAYLWLSLMLLCATLNQMTFSGTANMLLWQDPTKWGNHALTLTGMACQGIGIAFSLSFLRSWKHAPRLAWGAVVFVALGTAVCLLSLAGEPRVFYGVIAYVLLGPPVIGVLTLEAARRGSVAVRLFLLSWGFVLVGEVLFCMVYLDLLPDNAFTANFMHVSVLGASVAWSFTLTRQIRVRAKQQRMLLEQEVALRTAELERALGEVKTLEGLLPVCSNCKKIRDGEGAWHPMEAYVSQRTGAGFSHGICPDCATELYPKYYPSGGKSGHHE